MQTKTLQSYQGTPFLQSPWFLPLCLSLGLFPWIMESPTTAISLLFIIVLCTIICLRPTMGVYLIIACIPLHALKIALCSFWASQATNGVNIGSLGNAQELTFSLGQFEYWVFYPFQLAAYSTIPALLFCQNKWKRTITSNQAFISRRCDRLMILLPITFFVWGIFSLLWVPSPMVSAYSLLRFLSNFILIFFIVNVLTRYEMIIKALTIYFIFALFLTFSAVISTWYPFFNSYIIGQNDFNVIHLIISLTNTGTSYSFEKIGMSDGYGWAAKHQLGMYVVTAILISPVLYRHFYHSFIIRLGILIGILPLAMLLHRGPIKVSVIGSFLVVSVFAILIPKLRNMFMVIMILMITLNVVGIIGGQYERVPIKNKMGMTTGNIENATSKSEYEAGTMSYRFGLWKKTVRRSIKNRGMGSGGDSLMRDITFMGIHSCSLPLNIIHDYGILGFSCFFLFMFIPIKETWLRISKNFNRKIDDIRWLQIWVLAALFTCLLDHAIDLFYWDHQIYFLTGLLWAILRLKQKTTPSSISPHKRHQPLNSILQIQS